MGIITKKDLSIFRGTYLECKAQPTEDMKIYLAWDTQEIYIGNSYGEKVLYGVSKSLYRRIDEKVLDAEKRLESKMEAYIRENVNDVAKSEFEKIREDLFAVVDEYVLSQVNEKTEEFNKAISKNSDDVSTLRMDLEIDASRLLEHLKKYDDDISKLEEYKSSVSEEFNTLVKADSELSTSIKTIEGSLGSATERLDERIDNTNSEMYKMEDRLVSKVLFGQEIEELQSSIRENGTKIETDRTEIKDIKDQIALLEGSEEANQKLSEIKETINEVGGRVDSIEAEQNNISTRVSNLENGFTVIPTGNCLVYETAEAMQDTGSLREKYITDDRKFVVIFCTKALDNPSEVDPPYRYKMGRLYFFSGETNIITEISGGGSGEVEKDIITAIISTLNVENWPISAEISNNTYNAGDITFRISGELEAVQSYSLKFDGKDVGTLNVEGFISSTDEISIPGNVAGSHSLVLNVTPKSDEDYKEYRVTNGSQSRYVEFYQPSMVYLNDENLYRSKGLNKEYIIPSITVGDTVSFYVPASNPLSQYYLSNDFFGYMDFDEIAEEYREINGVENVLYYVYKIKFNGDATNAVIGLK